MSELIRYWKRQGYSMQHSAGTVLDMVADIKRHRHRSRPKRVLTWEEIEAETQIIRSNN